MDACASLSHVHFDGLGHPLSEAQTGNSLIVHLALPLVAEGGARPPASPLPLACGQAATYSG